MKKLRPRVRYFGGITTAVVFLLVTGSTLHYFSQRRQRRTLERRCDVLEKRLHDLENVVSSVDQRLQDEKNSSNSLASNDFLHSGRIGDSSNFSKPLARPRLLGRGSSGNWVYSDLRLPSGEVRRYYARKNSTAQELSILLSNIRADVQDSLVDVPPSLQDGRPVFVE